MTARTLAETVRGAYLKGAGARPMSRTRHPGKTRWGAAYVVLAVLFALRCSVAWAAADLPANAAFATVHGAAPSRVAALAAIKLPPARCEATNDDPPAPSADNLTPLRWAAPAPRAISIAVGYCVSAPALLPPVRGPPRAAA